MVNNIPLEKNFYSSKRNFHKPIISKNKKNNLIRSFISLGLIIILSCFITHNIYVYTNSKDLGFATEYNFTNGFSEENKLLRVQKMTLIYCDGDTAIVEAYGLSKKTPHQSIAVKGSFKKEDNKYWIFQNFMVSE